MSLYFNTNILYSWRVIICLTSVDAETINKIRSNVFTEKESKSCERFINLLEKCLAEIVNYAHEIVCERDEYCIYFNSQYDQESFKRYVYFKSKQKFVNNLTFPLLKDLSLGATVSQIVELVTLDVVTEAHPIGEIEFFEKIDYNDYCI